MRRFRWLLVLAGLLHASNVQAQNALLVPFASEAEMEAYLRQILPPLPPLLQLPPPKVTASPDLTPAVPRQRVPGGAVVMGRVVERGDDAGIPGVTVTLEGTGLGAVTDIDGNYAIYTDALSDTLRTQVRAEFAGFHPAMDTAWVAPGDSLVVSFELVAGPSSDELNVAYEAPVAAYASSDEITNTQTEGVDEGGIVKALGDYLVVLRRGRLFTIRVGGNRLESVVSADAFGPDVDPGGAWYDELLLVGRTAVVVGYSYARGGTELVLHDIGSDGQIRYRSTYHMRSNDYYSSENYASRVVDGKLVFYTPYYLRRQRGDVSVGDVLPSLRRWRAGGGTDAFEPIATYTSVYRPANTLRFSRAALHTVTSCDVRDGELDCSATAVFGPSGHTFYVSNTAVYVWLSEWQTSAKERPVGVAYRLPLDGSRPGALGVEGGPVDQFSFLEADDHLNVLVTNDGAGQWMWGAERERDAAALFRAPLSAFALGTESAPASWYTPLPSPNGSVTNRFVGDWLLYGASREGYDSQFRTRWIRSSYPVYAVQIQTGRVTALRIPNRVERIEAMGRDAVVVGSNGNDLVFASVALGDRALVEASYRLEGAMQGETRSHGFFYRVDGQREGVAGLPVRYSGGRYASLREGSASVVYLRNRNLRLTPYGALDAHPGRGADDGCRASCVDWYGNARPIFLGERVFALLGYELVEGRVRQGAVRETRRVSFAPRAEERTEQQP